MSTSYFDEPCKSCDSCKSKWEPKECGFKTGDILVKKNDIDTIRSLYIYLRNNRVLYVPNYVTVNSSYILRIPWRLKDYMVDKLIADSFATWKDYFNLEYASQEVIKIHDNRAKELYAYEPFSDWFFELINKEPEKIEIAETFHLLRRSTTDPKTVYKHLEKVFTTPNMIKDVIFSDPATIIFWEDGTKTVVKTQDGEEYDKEKGFAMAVCKKVFGNERDYYNVFKRWMRKGKEVKKEE
jgi:hypothetical protein